MAVIINGAPAEIPELASTHYLEEPRLRLRKTDDVSKRLHPLVRGIVLHTTKGIPGGSDLRKQVIRPGYGASVNAGVRTSRYWSSTLAPGGAHLVVDFDGHVSCCADLLLDCAHHAGPVNQQTIGVEIYQGNDAEMYEGQLDTVVRLCDFLTRHFGIQRQIPDKYRKAALPRFTMAGSSGKDFFGIYGHREVSNNRGEGDPGDAIFRRLGQAGYEDWNLSDYEDLKVWERRQNYYDITPSDGIPGPATVAAFAAKGFAHGLWVARPGDAPSERKPYKRRASQPNLV